MRLRFPESSNSNNNCTQRVVAPRCTFLYNINILSYARASVYAVRPYYVCARCRPENNITKEIAQSNYTSHTRVHILMTDPPPTFPYCCTLISCSCTCGKAIIFGIARRGPLKTKKIPRKFSCRVLNYSKVPAPTYIHAST